jgi:hypothetical protein
LGPGDGDRLVPVEIELGEIVGKGVSVGLGDNWVTVTIWTSSSERDVAVATITAVLVENGGFVVVAFVSETNSVAFSEIRWKPQTIPARIRMNGNNPTK